MTPWTVAHQAPLFVRLPRQEHWSKQPTIPFSRGSSWPRDGTQLSHTVGGFFTSWATREALTETYTFINVFFKSLKEILLFPKDLINVVKTLLWNICIWEYNLHISLSMYFVVFYCFQQPLCLSGSIEAVFTIIPHSGNHEFEPVWGVHRPASMLSFLFSQLLSKHGLLIWVEVNKTLSFYDLVIAVLCYVT